MDVICELSHEVIEQKHKLHAAWSNYFEQLLHLELQENNRLVPLCCVSTQDEWTGEQKLQYTDVPEDIKPEEIRPMGNYAVSIVWPDGFNQVK